MAKFEGVFSAQWKLYEASLLAFASERQKRILKHAFYCGATSLIANLMLLFESGHEPTEKDMSIMEGIYQELTEYQTGIQEEMAAARRAKEGN